jgi:asparagine synthase (glutamine-hydrolysing)
MCGITGFIGSSLNPELNQENLQNMASAILHRGPDDVGFFNAITSDNHYVVSLAHRRLSIIDLSSGHQPMGNDNGSIQIVFNGEIYNFQTLRDELITFGYHFSTASDTEVIVHAYEQWGVHCVDHLRGMFAFAIWDARTDCLFLARDRFGKKPLYICEHEGTLVFASEIKSILKFPKIPVEVDLEAMSEYYTYRYVPAPRTLFNKIRKLMPGCYATWIKGQLIETRYYQPPDSKPWHTCVLPPDPVDMFLNKLDEAVRIRMVSDVPFGAFLSGGLDSSAIVGLMSRHSTQPINTFSMGFIESSYCELRYAKEIATQFNTNHHELVISSVEMMALLPEMIRFYDAPLVNTSDIAVYMLAVEASKTVKMVLTGEGADEFLGGYPKHLYEHLVQPYQFIPRWLRKDFIEPVIRALPYRFNRAKTAIAAIGIESFEERMPRWFGALSKEELAELLVLKATVKHPEVTNFSSTSNSPLRRILCFDQNSWLPDNLLERGDKMTMAASIEARMPFMDHELAEFVATLPDKFRVRGKTTKWILRQAMKQIVPETILNRPKIGFKVPIDEWFRDPMRDYLYEHLTGPDSLTKEYYQVAVLEKVLADHVSGRQNHEKLLWSLLNLEIWHRQYLG